MAYIKVQEQQKASYNISDPILHSFFILHSQKKGCLFRQPELVDADER
jgi:hypothetical protein